jgi:hypothetical protein
LKPKREFVANQFWEHTNCLVASSRFRTTVESGFIEDKFGTIVDVKKEAPFWQFVSRRFELISSADQ